jgi:hypothetical protein
MASAIYKPVARESAEYKAFRTIPDQISECSVALSDRDTSDDAIAICERLDNLSRSAEQLLFKLLTPDEQALVTKQYQDWVA